MNDEIKSLLKKLPSVDRLSKTSAIKMLLSRYPRKLILYEIRENIKKIRNQIISNNNHPEINLENITNFIIINIKPKLNNSIKRAINGTGIILNRHMGNAPFAKKSQNALLDSVMNYCNFQINQETGKFIDSDSHIENILREITGCEAATVVNNNAGATMLVLNTFAKDKDVIVSRGQLEDIDDKFRISDIIELSGSNLNEVGTTNRTHLKDYKNAIDESKSGCILHVSVSSYSIKGFTKIVPVEELAILAKNHSIPLYENIENGTLVNLENFGFNHKPTIQNSLQAGADMVSFSGNKLLGGPQCGIIVGKKKYIDEIKNSNLYKILKCDKMTYAVLEATLRLFLDEEKLKINHPVLKMLTEPIDEIKKRGQSLTRRIKASVGDKVITKLEEAVSVAENNLLAENNITTYILSLQSNFFSSEEIFNKMCKCTPPIFGKIENDNFTLDCRTILHEEIGMIIKAVEEIFK